METKMSSYVITGIVLLSVFLTVLENAAGATVGPGSSCINGYTYTVELNKNANGAYETTDDTVAKCKATCTADTNCKSIDFDTLQYACWIHTRDVTTRDAPGVDHYTKKVCTVSSTAAPSIASSSFFPSSTGGTVDPADCVDNSRYELHASHWASGGQEAVGKDTVATCLAACTAKSTTTCYGFDFNTKTKECFLFPTAPVRKAGSTDVNHYIRLSCFVSSTLTTLPSTSLPASTRIPNRNLPVTFICIHTNHHNNTMKNKTAFIETYRRVWCDFTGVRCTRLIKPADLADVTEGSSGNIVVAGELEPAREDETDTQDVMEEFKKDYPSFRFRLSAENAKTRLLPKTNGFSWERVYSTLAPTQEVKSTEPLGLKTEYWVLIAVAAIFLVVLAIALVAIICLRRKKSESSPDKTETKQRLAEEKEQRRQAKEEERERKKKEAEEKKAKEKERQQEKKDKEKEKKDRDVEKAPEEETYSEPDVVPSPTDDNTARGLSDDDKAY